MDLKPVFPEATPEQLQAGEKAAAGFFLAVGITEEEAIKAVSDVEYWDVMHFRDDLTPSKHTWTAFDALRGAVDAAREAMGIRSATPHGPFDPDAPF